MLPRPGRLDRRALLFLIVWSVGLLVPPLHVVFEEELAGSRDGTAATARCEACERTHAPSARATVACAGGSGCNDPHHHHRPLAHPDPSDCTICSTQFARVADVPAMLVFLAPCAVKFVGAPPVSLSPVASRRVISLARGPPSPPLAG